MKTCSWEPIYVGTIHTEILEPLLEGARSSSEECFSPEGSELGSQSDRPTGRVLVEGVVPNPRVPPVAAEEDEEIHPLWRLLELAGYQLW